MVATAPDGAPPGLVAAALAEATKLSRIELPELPAEKRWTHCAGWVAVAEATDGTPRFPNAPSDAAAN